MDLRTGRTYESREAALAAGVPASDIVEVVKTPRGPEPRVRREPLVPTSNQQRHQGARERVRRLSRVRP
jgi:hypothetical protein